MRCYDGADLLVVNNLSRFVQPVELDLREFDGLDPVELFGETVFPRITASCPTSSASGRTGSTGSGWSVAAHNWRHAARAAAALDQSGRARA